MHFVTHPTFVLCFFFKSRDLNREKSLIRVAEHRVRIAKAQKEAHERAEHGFEMWKKERTRVLREKRKIVTRFEAACKDWVTEENLDEKIERIVDDFFIISAHRTELAQPRNDEQERKV